MSNDNDNTIPDNIDQAKGRAKQAVGDLTGDEKLEREGERDEAAGDVKSVVDDVSEKVKDTVDDIQRKIS